jgi:hypothetical protein
MTYFMVLTIYASQIAPGEENIADAIIATYYRLFSLVDTDRCNIQTRIGFAISKAFLKSVNFTLSRTKIAVPQS